ncbi:MAG: site-specific tyrosine recombinase XerC [Planctomycetota bacterium]
MPDKLPTIKPIGDINDPSGFHALLTQHAMHLQVRNFSIATIKKRITYVRAFAVWSIERDLTQPRQVTRAMLESYQRHLFRYRKANGEPLSWGSQHLHLKELRQFFAWLARHHHIAVNPAADLELPKQPATLPKAILTADEVERVLSQPDTNTPLGLRDRAIFETLYSTGIRRGECCNLKVDDIHVDRKALFVHRGKGQKDRYVPIGNRALLWIAKYVETVRDDHSTDTSDTTLFLTAGGTAINPDTLTEYGRRYIAAAGIDKPGACHVFRHSMATLMHEHGADLSMIQSILGHAKSDTTRIYARTSLRRLLDTHAATHPAEQIDPNPGDPPASTPSDVQ